MRYVGSIDQGTTSSRFLIFDEKLRIVASHQIEHKQITPQPGWLEHDPQEIFDNCCLCIVKAVEKLRAADPTFTRLNAIGITNQRETTVAWDRNTKNVLCNAIVWSDARTSEIVRSIVSTKGNGNASFLADSCGLPVSTYFSALKMKWMLTHVPAVQDAAKRKTLCFGTIDSWLIWKLTGERSFVTDVTNASRTMLMNLHTLSWDRALCDVFDVPLFALPAIHSCSEPLGVITTHEAHVCDVLGSTTVISGCIGDQQGALCGNLCFAPGQAKNTYGTGCFLLANVGERVVKSRNGLLATVGYQLGPNVPVHYALEGSISGAGACMQWMRDKLNFYSNYSESELAARSVTDTGGVFFVPAFSGLLAPHWKPEARGTIVGMTLQTTKAHIIRAALEAIALQVCDVVKAMEADAAMAFSVLKVDGGLAKSTLLMETQANFLGLRVDVPAMLETTALGAAICAGLAVGVWSSVERIQAIAKENQNIHSVEPMMTEEQRREKFEQWNRAVQRSVGWASNL